MNHLWRIVAVSFLDGFTGAGLFGNPPSPVIPRDSNPKWALLERRYAATARTLAILNLTSTLGAAVFLAVKEHRRAAGSLLCLAALMLVNAWLSSRKRAKRHS
jgi:hypothetical protein